MPFIFFIAIIILTLAETALVVIDKIDQEQRATEQAAYNTISITCNLPELQFVPRGEPKPNILAAMLPYYNSEFKLDGGKLSTKVAGGYSLTWDFVMFYRDAAPADFFVVKPDITVFIKIKYFILTEDNIYSNFEYLYSTQCASESFAEFNQKYRLIQDSIPMTGLASDYMILEVWTDDTLGDKLVINNSILTVIKTTSIGPSIQILLNS